MTPELPEEPLSASELAPDAASAPVLAPTSPLTRGRAIAEVVLCSGFPTQLAIAAFLASIGIAPGVSGQLAPRFVFLLTAIDTVLVIALVVVFLRASHESPRDVFFGSAPLGREAMVGVTMLPLVFVLVIGIQLVLRTVAPSLDNVDISPFMPLLESPWLLAGFVLLVLIGGGVREELQRAFLLHRFEQRLGGARLGVLITSLGFGLGHTLQGWDAAIVTGVLGALWGWMYLTRRSVGATVTNHALFNAAQVAAGYAAAGSLSALLFLP